MENILIARLRTDFENLRDIVEKRRMMTWEEYNAYGVEEDIRRNGNELWHVLGHPKDFADEMSVLFDAVQDYSWSHKWECQENADKVYALLDKITSMVPAPEKVLTKEECRKKLASAFSGQVYNCRHQERGFNYALDWQGCGGPDDWMDWVQGDDETYNEAMKSVYCMGYLTDGQCRRIETVYSHVRSLMFRSNERYDAKAIDDAEKECNLALKYFDQENDKAADTPGSENKTAFSAVS